MSRRVGGGRRRAGRRAASSERRRERRRTGRLKAYAEAARGVGLTLIGGGSLAGLLGQPRAELPWIAFALALGLLMIAGHAILSGMVYAREKDDEESGT